MPDLCRAIYAGDPKPALRACFDQVVACTKHLKRGGFGWHYERRCGEHPFTFVRCGCQLESTSGLGAEDAQASAVLFYSFIFGQSLLYLDQTPRKRASLIAACANTLVVT